MTEMLKDSVQINEVSKSGNSANTGAFIVREFDCF